MHSVFKKVLGDPQAKAVKRLRKRVADVNKLEEKYKKLSDAKLREQTEVLKKRLPWLTDRPEAFSAKPPKDTFSFMNLSNSSPKIDSANAELGSGHSRINASVVRVT